jgi:hypothetical protein
MTFRKNDKTSRKRVFFFALLAGAFLYSVYCFVIEPIYISSLYDVAYEGSVLPDFLYYLGRIVEIVAISVCYAAAAMSIYLTGRLTFGGTFGLYLILGGYKYVANLAVEFIGGDGDTSLLLLDAFFAILYLALEIVPFAISCAIFSWLFKSFGERQKILVKAGKEERVYPFKKLYDKRNPFMTAAIVTAFALFIPKLIGKIVSDAIEIVEIINLPLMIVSYLMIFVLGVLAYVTVIMTFTLFFEKTVRE